LTSAHSPLMATLMTFSQTHCSHIVLL
jgi:hypothetical protein